MLSICNQPFDAGKSRRLRRWNSADTWSCSLDITNPKVKLAIALAKRALQRSLQHRIL